MNRIQYFEELESTNTYILENMATLDDKTAVMAGLQTHGKGRRGKHWTAHKGDSLTISILLKHLSVEDTAILPILTGIATLSCIESVCHISVGLKWPNDVLFEGKKLCGLLCESRISGGTIHAVCGIGINLNQSDEQLSSPNIESKATSLKNVTGKTTDIMQMANHLVEHFDNTIDRYHHDGLPALIQFYRSRCINIGKELTIHREESILPAVGVDINEQGELICRLEDNSLITVHAGEVSIRTSNQTST